MISCPIKKACSQNASALAIKYHGHNVSYGQFDQMIDTIGLYLIAEGLKYGERIAVLSANSDIFAALLFTGFRYGFVTVPLNTHSTPAEWNRQMDMAACRFLLYDSTITIADWSDIKTIPIDTLNNADLSTRYDFFEIRDDHDDALIIFTSGSSGPPRGIVISWGNIDTSAAGINQRFGLKTHDTWMAVLPFFHVGGISIPWRTVVAGAGCTVYDRFDPVRIIKEIASQTDHSIILSVVPTMLRDLLEADQDNALSTTKAIMVGGDAFASNLQQQCRERRLPLATTYGMTETASAVTLLPPGNDRSETAGTVLPGREVRIVDSDGSDCLPGETGDIMIKGPVVAGRYLDDSRLTDSNGWLPTADRGFLDGDEFLTVVGRRDRVIISGGENIDLDAVEDALRRCNNVRQAAVVAVDDDRWGKRPLAFVETSSDDVSIESLRETLQAALPKLSIPDKIILVEAIPYTGTGKIDRARLIQRYNL